MNGNQAEAGGGVPAFYQRKHGIYAFPCDAGAVLFDNGQLRISEIGDFSAIIAYDFELSGNLKPHLPGYGQTAQGADVICHTSIGILDDVPVFVDDVFVVGIAHSIPFHIYGNNLTAVFPEYHFHYFVADVGAFFPIKAAVELDDFPTAAL